MNECAKPMPINQCPKCVCVCVCVSSMSYGPFDLFAISICLLLNGMLSFQNGQWPFWTCVHSHLMNLMDCVIGNVPRVIMKGIIAIEIGGLFIYLFVSYWTRIDHWSLLSSSALHSWSVHDLLGATNWPYCPRQHTHTRSSFTDSTKVIVRSLGSSARDPFCIGHNYTQRTRRCNSIVIKGMSCPINSQYKLLFIH